VTNSTRSNSVPRIAIYCDSLAGGAGGIDFLCFFVASLSSVSPGTSWSILIPSNSVARSFAALAKRGLRVLSGMKPYPMISNDELIDAIKSLGARVDIIDYRDTVSGLASAMRQCSAEVLFLCGKSLGRSFPFPWIGYIGDLQHKRLPHFFSKMARWHRDRLFSKLLADAPAVVVNAVAVVQDIGEFYPDHRARLFALPFCPQVNLKRFSNASDSEVRAAYHLPASYFMISNQFWIHKSHETAFMALRLVRDAGHDVHLVCTGSTHDYRWPEHFNNLKAIIEKNNLRDYVRILGLIPKGDQLAIMRGSLAVIQPTLFEGGPGGGSVYDAVSTRTPCIVSDIPVNREIDIGVVRFFAAGSAEDLAAKIVDMLVNPPQKLGEEETFAQLTSRQHELGNLLLDIANIVANPGSALRV
jgi:glycosyltransferase involved in cell wall biosynthesis